MSKELEGGSLEWISVPAFQHDLVHIGLSHANLFRVGLRLWIQDVSWVGHSVSPFNLFVKGIKSKPSNDVFQFIPAQSSLGCSFLRMRIHISDYRTREYIDISKKVSS